MPYMIVRVPNGFKVMTTDTGKFHSNDPLPYATAVKQLQALHINTGEGRPTTKTHREHFLAQHDLPDRGYSLQELSKISYVPMDILQEVYNRGIGAYSTQPSSVRLKGSYVKGVNAPMKAKLSKEQWAMARVYSFLDGNPKHDNDLRRPRGSGRDWYLEAVKAKARHFGLSDDIEYSTDKTHKFQIHTPEGYIRRFGLRGYNDFLLWSKEEADGKVPKGTANEHRKSYRRRALLIKGNWKADPYSPNNLAINLLW